MTTERIFSAEGWNYQPGTFRCDRGWNSAGISYECRNPGVWDIDGKWLCETCAEVPLTAERRQAQEAFTTLAAWASTPTFLAHTDAPVDLPTAYAVLGDNAAEIIIQQAEYWAEDGGPQRAQALINELNMVAGQ